MENPKIYICNNDFKSGIFFKSSFKNSRTYKKEFTADHYVDMKELIRDFQPSVEMTTGNEEKMIWEWSMTEEMERLLE